MVKYLLRMNSSALLSLILSVIKAPRAIISLFWSIRISRRFKKFRNSKNLSKKIPLKRYKKIKRLLTKPMELKTNKKRRQKFLAARQI